MNPIDKARKDYQDARRALRCEWKTAPMSRGYKFMHDPYTGKHTGILWAFFAVAIVVAVFALAPNTLVNVGTQWYHLNATDLYECPECHLSTTTGDMATYDGYYYYCPECGHVMGSLGPGMKHGPN